MSQVVDLKARKTAAPDQTSAAHEVRLWNLGRVALYLSLSYWTVRGMALRGDIPYVRAGRRILLDREDVDRWIAEHKETWQ